MMKKNIKKTLLSVLLYLFWIILFLFMGYCVHELGAQASKEANQYYNDCAAKNGVVVYRGKIRICEIKDKINEKKSNSRDHLS
jgi:hypothetical protein